MTKQMQRLELDQGPPSRPPAGDYDAQLQKVVVHPDGAITAVLDIYNPGHCDTIEVELVYVSTPQAADEQWAQAACLNILHAKFPDYYVDQYVEEVESAWYWLAYFTERGPDGKLMVLRDTLIGDVREFIETLEDVTWSDSTGDQFPVSEQ